LISFDKLYYPRGKCSSEVVFLYTLQQQQQKRSEKLKRKLEKENIYHVVTYTLTGFIQIKNII